MAHHTVRGSGGDDWYHPRRGGSVASPVLRGHLGAGADDDDRLAKEDALRGKAHLHTYTHTHWHTHVLDDGTIIHHSHPHSHSYWHYGIDETEQERATRVAEDGGTGAAASARISGGGAGGSPADESP